jgi:hypothetical protein
MRSERCALCGGRLSPFDPKDVHDACLDGRWRLPERERSPEDPEPEEEEP